MTGRGNYRQQLNSLPEEWRLPLHPDPEKDEEQCRRQVGLYRALVPMTEEKDPWSNWDFPTLPPLRRPEYLTV